MTSLDGKFLSNHDFIEKYIFDFYTTLVGTNSIELKGIGVPAIRSGNTLSRDLAQ